MPLFHVSPTHFLYFLILLHPVCLQGITVQNPRPTFGDSSYKSVPIAGKIALEEHVSTPLFQASFTTPFENNTNEAPFGTSAYQTDVRTRLNDTDIAERVHQMDLANISISVVSLNNVGIQGIFNATLAAAMAAGVNDQLYRDYKQGNYPDRFEFLCSVALQAPQTAATELTRCVRELGGKGVLVSGYTNNGSASEVVYLDDAAYVPFWGTLASLGVPLYLHPRMPPPDQQRAYAGYEFLAGSPYGFSVETGAHALRLMLSGLFDAHPSLQVVLGRCGDVLPSMLRRIDERMRHYEPGLWKARESMRYYWEHNFYVTTAGVSDVGVLMDALRLSGEDRVMFSVDYPFQDDVEASAWFDGVQVSERTKQAIAYGNAKKLLNIE